MTSVPGETAQVGVPVPPEVVARIIARRGRVRVFERFEPGVTALLVIDLQRFYTRQLPDAGRVVLVVNSLASRLRELGGRVVWVRTTSSARGHIGSSSRPARTGRWSPTAPWRGRRATIAAR